MYRTMMPGVLSAVLAAPVGVAGASWPWWGHSAQAPAVLAGGSGRAGHAAAISPALEPESDSHFFHQDYLHDLQPKIGRPEKAISGHRIYPDIVGEDPDADFVKDENGDNGRYEAQMTYDRLRGHIKNYRYEAAQAQAAEHEASEQAEHFGAEAAKSKKTAAQARADAEAARRAREAAEEEVRRLSRPEGEEHHAAAARGTGAAGGAGHGAADRVAEAAARLKKEEADFVICQRELEEKRAELERMRAEHLAKQKEVEAEAALADERLAKAKDDFDAVRRQHGPSDEHLRELEGEEADLARKVKELEQAHDKAVRVHKRSEEKIQKTQDEMDEIARELRRVRLANSPPTKPTTSTPKPAAASTAK